MGTIVSRQRKDGSTGYTAQILIKRKGKILHREAQTFDQQRTAKAWIARRETELAAPNALDRPNDPTLADVIDRYISETNKQIGKTKSQVLKAIKAHDIADKRCSKITSACITAWATDLGKARQPQTVANYLSHLSAIFAVARPAWGYPLDHRTALDAATVTKRLGITSKSGKRERRPTLDEIDRLMAHFGRIRQRRKDANDMQSVIWFAIFSTRRLEEITRIRWSDYEPQHKRVMVRDLKHPGDKLGNDQWCDLPDRAIQIIDSMPKTSDRIFPYSTDAIGAAFTRACKVLQIADLHFHDLRHDGVSLLFEMGLNIPHVAAVSGHRSWQSLKRYTHIRQSGDKYATKKPA